MASSVELAPIMTTNAISAPFRRASSTMRRTRVTAGAAAGARLGSRVGPGRGVRAAAAFVERLGGAAGGARPVLLVGAELARGRCRAILGVLGADELRGRAGVT
jgi:hypothetical protein